MIEQLVSSTSVRLRVPPISQTVHVSSDITATLSTSRLYLANLNAVQGVGQYNCLPAPTPARPPALVHTARASPRSGSTALSGLRLSGILWAFRHW